MKKLLLALLVLFMLVGCTGKNVDPDPKPEPPTVKPDTEASEYLTKLKNFTPRPKDKSKTEDNPEFNAFLDQVFKDIIEENYLYMHHSVVDYKAMGLTKPEVKFGDIKYNEPDTEDTVKQLNDLLAFDYNTLSYNQQYDYDLLEYSLYETLANADYQKYSFLYGSNSDSISSIFTNLNDFVFNSREDVEDYNILVKDVKRYIESIKAFTEAQIKDGIHMSDASAQNTIDLIDRILSSNENSLITSYNERIDQVDFVSAEEKETFKKENADVVNNDIVPALQDTLEFVKAQVGIVKDNREVALYNLDQNYAELTYLLNGSYNLPIDDIFNQTLDVYEELINNYIAAYNNENVAKQYGEIESHYADIMHSTDAREILDYLSKKLVAYYPDLGEVDYDVANADASSTSSSTVAYYWSSPLDKLDQNIIRINPNNIGTDPIDTFATLAHEGFPGHLYDHVYFYRTKPHNFRNTQGFIGYTEGHAVRAQVDALHFGDILKDVDDQIYDIITFEDMYYFPAYSLLDMAVNYYAYDDEQLAELLSDLGLNPGAASGVVELLTDMPGVYCSYGLGYTYHTKLREYAKEQLKDKFDIVKYNEAVVSHGDMPFCLVKQVVDEYIAENK